MSIQTNSLPRTIENSTNFVFFETPRTLNINEDLKTDYSRTLDVDTLITELKSKGPLVALGKMGPAFYAEPAFKLSDKIGSHDIHGWTPGTHQNKGGNNYAIILGARKLEERELIYFTMSDDITPNSDSYLRTHKPSSTDNKIYVISNKTFSNFLNDIYPAAQPVDPASLDKEGETEADFLAQLSALNLNSILDRGDGEKKCKDIGQKIFNKFKAQNNGNSDSGREVVQNICDKVAKTATDGRLRKQYIERAWNGIGDSNWKWQG